MDEQQVLWEFSLIRKELTDRGYKVGRRLSPHWRWYVKTPGWRYTLEHSDGQWLVTPVNSAQSFKAMTTAIAFALQGASVS